jgi:hypothetical protein
MGRPSLDPKDQTTTLKLRIPERIKQAFMLKCKRERTEASEVIRRLMALWNEDNVDLDYPE